MDEKQKNLGRPRVILNCQSHESLHPELLRSLENQTQKFDLQILTSSKVPSRLNQIESETPLYFFFDEDVILPHANYLREVCELFNSRPSLLFLGGKYLNSKKLSYLSRCYNAIIENWLLTGHDSSTLNLPGGAWIISGKIKPHLSDWKEPSSWAGEDTYTLRWLQQKGLMTHYDSKADVYHFPRSPFFHFCKRAFLQGRARSQLKLQSRYQNIKWRFIWRNWLYWPGWFLHQSCVEIGSFIFKMMSRKAKTTPTISPTA